MAEGSGRHGAWRECVSSLCPQSGVNVTDNIWYIDVQMLT